MTVVNPHAAGIDVGDTIHVVCVPADRDSEPVRTFGTMSCDLEKIASWLSQCGVTSVAMESTGVYWKPLFSYLVRKGFEVYLVNSAHVKNVKVSRYFWRSINHLLYNDFFEGGSGSLHLKAFCKF